MRGGEEERLPCDVRWAAGGGREGGREGRSSGGMQGETHMSFSARVGGLTWKEGAWSREAERRALGLAECLVCQRGDVSLSVNVCVLRWPASSCGVRARGEVKVGLGTLE